MVSRQFAFGSLAPFMCFIVIRHPVAVLGPFYCSGFSVRWHTCHMSHVTDCWGDEDCMFSAFRFLLPAVDWRQIPIATYLGGQEAFVYTLLTVVFLSCLLTTIFIPEKTGSRGGGRDAVVRRALKSRSSRSCPHWLLLQPQKLHVALGRCASACVSVLPRVYACCVQVPAVIWRLFVAEICSWMALMSIMLFFADFMGEGLYQGVPNAEPESRERKQYDEGRVGAYLAPPIPV